jgi:hypothetical protein
MIRCPQSLPFALLFCLYSCQSASELLYQPKPEDPNDGISSLPQAGVNTVMDWGPGQGLLLKDYTDLKIEKAHSQKLLDEKVAENLTLQAQLSAEKESKQKELNLRLQSEALVESLQKSKRELEARILSLAIEKAKLEQTNLLAEIARLQRSLEDVGTATEAAAPAPGGK